MEGLTINYDATVRDSDGSLIQMYYGEDGLDIPKSRFLSAEQFEFLVDNRRAIAEESLLQQLKANSLPAQTIGKLQRKIQRWEKRHGDPLAKRRLSEFSKFSQDHRKPAGSKKDTIVPNCGRSRASLSLMKKWIRADEATKASYREQCKPCPEPLTATYRQDLEFGVLCERLEGLLDKYLERRPNSLTTSIGRDELREVLCAKVMKTLCPPGEPVGLLGNEGLLYGLFCLVYFRAVDAR